MDRSVLSLIFILGYLSFTSKFTHRVHSESEGRAWPPWTLHLGQRQSFARELIAPEVIGSTRAKPNTVASVPWIRWDGAQRPLHQSTS